MHDVAPLIKDLAIILGVASIVTLLFQKIRQPVVLGYLLAGLIIGPYTPPHTLISDLPNIKILSELGVIFLMFSLGLEFSFHKLKRVGFSASITGLVEVVIMMAIGFGIGRMLGWSFYDSIFLGAALSISSTTIIIKALEELNLKTKRFADIVFGILIVEDLLAILLLVGISTLVVTDNVFSMEMGWAVIKLILVVGGWFLLGYFLVPSLFRRIVHYASEENLTIISIALCLFLVCVAAYFDYSTALGAFIMGSILAETPLVHRIEHIIRPVRNIFGAVFFVSVGMFIDPGVIIDYWPLVLSLCAVTIFGKVLVTTLGAFLTGQSPHSAVRIGFSMGQIGEFSFILASLGLALNVTSHTLFPLIIAVAAITTFTTPYLIKSSGFLGRVLEQNLPPKVKYIFESYSSWIHRLLASSTQQSVYRKAVTRFIINGVVVAIIFGCTQFFLLPQLSDFFHSLWIAKIIGWLITLLISSTFIWGMLRAFQIEPRQEAAINRYNPAFYFGILATSIEVTLLSIHYFDTWLISFVLAFVAMSLFFVLYKHLDKSYHWFENKLINNIGLVSNQEHYEALAPWDSHLIEMTVPSQSELVGKTLQQLQLRQDYGINVVSIARDSRTLFGPRGDVIIFPLDQLIILGSDKQIDHFAQQFIHLSPVSHEPTQTIQKFSLKTILLEPDHPYVGQSIRDSLIREKVNGLIVGIEHHGIRILNPDSTYCLEAGDLLFIVGETKRFETL
jgi:CPA2 family monovalent cation:H+ antiporter-2